MTVEAEEGRNGWKENGRGGGSTLSACYNTIEESDRSYNRHKWTENIAATLI